MVASAVDELWKLALDRKQIDPAEVWHALEITARSDEPLDLRSRLLIHTYTERVIRRFGLAGVSTSTGLDR